MKLFKKMKDGHVDSQVTGYFLVEIKSLFSITLLKFSNSTREVFHSHAFNAWTLWLKGSVKEHLINGETVLWSAGQVKYTPRHRFHKVECLQKDAWAISIRGPWAKTWKEFIPDENKFVTLTHGRKVVGES